VVLTCGAGSAIAAWLVRRYAPYASGSGIPHVEAVLNQELPQAPFSLVPIKFFGGLLASIVISYGKGVAKPGHGSTAPPVAPA
jgi:H+/Cl- antiporter ClcA